MTVIIPGRGQCPLTKCRSRLVYDLAPDSPTALAIARSWGFADKHSVPMQRCSQCHALWERVPDDWAEDCVERKPCDNCAYRGNSPEKADAAAKQHLHDIAENAAIAGILSPGAACFSCHKGVPLVVSVDQTAFGFVHLGSDIDPLSQPCAGFLRTIWHLS